MVIFKKAFCVVLILLFCISVFISVGAVESGDGGDGGDTSEGSEFNGFSVSYGYAPLVAPDGTEASNYIKGSAPATDYVAAGGSHTVAENSYTFRDYVFAGWSCGGTVYKPGEVIYNITSNMKLIATWVRSDVEHMAVIGVLTYKGDEALSLAIGESVELKAGKWLDNRGRIFEGGSSFMLSFNAAELVSYEGGAETVKVSYDGGGVSDGVQGDLLAEKGEPFVVDGCFGEREGYSFIGWQDKSGKIYLAGDTCVPTGDTVFTAMWQESTKPAPDYCSVTLSAGEGGSISPEGKVTVLKRESIEFSVSADKGYRLSSVLCDGAELGTGGSYIKTVNADMVISASFVGKPEPESEPVSEKPVESAPAVSEVSACDEAEMSEQTFGDESTDTDDGEKKSKDGDESDRRLIIVLLCLLFIVLGGWFVAISVLNKKKRRKKKSKR